MMTPREAEQIRKALETRGKGLSIRIHPASNGAGRAIAEFCEALAALSPKVNLQREESAAEVPFFEIADNVSYAAVPLGAELPPFLEFITRDGNAPGTPLPDGRLLDLIQVPAKLTVFIAPHCPHCPRTVAALLSLAAVCPHIHVRLVDGEMFPQAAADARVRSAPTTILDDDFRWTGAVDLSEIVDAIHHRDPARLSADTLQQMIEEKSPEVVSRMMMDSGRIYPAMLDLLTHEKWSVRLGAMVVFEFINTASDLLAREVLDALWDRFDTATDDVKGDILYLYGESGREETMERLSQVRDADYPASVREAALEALNTLMDP